ncbi:hypothetical protein N0V85_001929 [Neurospora sp. IMI 360204]|nr:hypothetical protein N0V85_001929 [Neurospora sp. IMI 360204]
MASPKFKVFDCYATLGVSPYADTKDIQKAYHRLALERHPDKNGNSAESTAMFQKLGNAYEVLIDISRRKEYDFSAEQEYLRTQEKMTEVQKGLRNKPHGAAAAAADPELLSSHENSTQLAQTMAGLVRELKTIPDGREQQLQREIYELRQSYQTLQSLLKFRFNQIQILEKRNASLAENLRNMILAGNLRNKLTTYIHVDRLRRSLGTLGDVLQSFRDFASLKITQAYAKCRKVI